MPVATGQPWKGINMNLGSVCADISFQLERSGHQRQIKTFEERSTSKASTNESFSSCLFKVAQRAWVKMAKVAMDRPVSTLAYGLAGGGIVKINALPLSEASGTQHLSVPTMKFAEAFEECMLEHRHDNFPIRNMQARCLGELIGDTCSDREPGTSSRYNFGIWHDESNDRNQNVCRQLAGRAAGVHATVRSAHKTAEMIIKDVVRDVTDNQKEAGLADALRIIDHYGLRGEVDGSLIDSEDVSKWVSGHRSELQHGGHVWPPSYREFIHAASNRYKESGDIRDQETYRSVLDGIDRMNLEPYEDRYFGEIAQYIADELKV